MIRELRSFRRMPLEAEVVFQELSFTREAQVIRAKYKDVSGGGVLISSAHECPLGSILKMEIRVPMLMKQNNAPMAVVGQVVRIEVLDNGGYELGVKFLNSHDADLQSLISLINSSSDQATAP